MGTITIPGVVVSPLQIIAGELGNVYHGIKQTDPSFLSFGEAYFSSVLQGKVKGWKKHQKMILNLVVPVGEVKFVLYDERHDSIAYQQFFSITLSVQHYYRLTVPPEVWMAFQGVGESTNLVLNIASIPHDPTEAETRTLEEIPYF